VLSILPIQLPNLVIWSSRPERAARFYQQVPPGAVPGPQGPRYRTGGSWGKAYPYGAAVGVGGTRRLQLRVSQVVRPVQGTRTPSAATTSSRAATTTTLGIPVRDTLIETFSGSTLCVCDSIARTTFIYDHEPRSRPRSPPIARPRPHDQLASTQSEPRAFPCPQIKALVLALCVHLGPPEDREQPVKWWAT